MASTLWIAPFMETGLTLWVCCQTTSRRYWIHPADNQCDDQDHLLCIPRDHVTILIVMLKDVLKFSDPLYNVHVLIGCERWR